VTGEHTEKLLGRSREQAMAEFKARGWRQSIELSAFAGKADMDFHRKCAVQLGMSALGQ